ncbi:Uncharacterised protein [Bordetella pertussis]|nr:Uncharacterised protein [Bordetella pertussis]CFP59033.1 Uncharacterised protein [Bordetella pertussis]CFW32799.1 Uncharacterised protein [Bordetella pertussis]
MERMVTPVCSRIRSALVLRSWRTRARYSASFS